MVIPTLHPSSQQCSGDFYTMDAVTWYSESRLLKHMAYPYGDEVRYQQELCLCLGI
jgi:hypothetical protein